MGKIPHSGRRLDSRQEGGTPRRIHLIIPKGIEAANEAGMATPPSAQVHCSPLLSSGTPIPRRVTSRSGDSTIFHDGLPVAAAN